MEIKLIGALDYNKVENLLKTKFTNQEEIKNIIKELKEIEIARRSEIVSASGRLSRFTGNVFEILDLSEEKTLEQNSKFIERVCSMGHNSISDHDYLVFAIKNVTPIIEQIIIAERFSSFTIKSRREVDFSKAGFHIPNFYDVNGKIIKNNEVIKNEYKCYMQYLFDKYSEFLNAGVSKEDARFILPYNFYSNIIMGVDAHTLKNMIIKCTKTKYSNITELAEFGKKLYNIAKENCSYIINEIDNKEILSEDPVDIYLKEKLPKTNYDIIDKPVLLNSSNNIDDTILISSIMRRYGVSYSDSLQLYNMVVEFDPTFKETLMKKIVFEGDKQELAQVNFQFQIPLSFAVLTHLTRHRTHNILIPDFVPNIDLCKYKIPPKIEHNDELKNEFISIFLFNKNIYDYFKNEYNIREEDLIYFTLSGNMINVVTNMDGKTVEHILSLRECNKTQWETKEMAYGIHNEISKLESAQNFSNILGATCITKGICNEGKESCGRLEAIKKGKDFQYIKKI